MKHLITDWEEADTELTFHQLLYNQERRIMGEVMQTNKDDPNMRYVYGWWCSDEEVFTHDYSPDFEDAKAIVLVKLIEQGAVHQPKLRAMI